MATRSSLKAVNTRALREGEPALAGGVEDPRCQRQFRERRAHRVNEAVLIRIRVRQTERDRAVEGGAATGQRERHQGTDRDARQRRRGGHGRDALEAQGVRRGQRRRREFAHDPVGGDDVVGRARRDPFRLTPDVFDQIEGVRRDAIGIRISAGCDTTVPLTGTCKAARVTVVPATVSLSSGVLRVKTPPLPGAFCRSTPESPPHPVHPTGTSPSTHPPLALAP